MFISNINLKTSIASFSCSACKKQRVEHQGCIRHQTERILLKLASAWTFITSMRNLGLSGMMSLKTTAEVRAGKEQRTTNNLQLLKSSDPRKKCVLVLGITIQARPGHHTCILPLWVVYLTRSTMTSVDVNTSPPSPAARMFPAIQNVARALIIAPLRCRGMNSEK